MHFYQGLPITLYYFIEDKKPNIISTDSGNTMDLKQRKNRQLTLRKVTIGPEGPEKGQMFHATITKNTWFARILDKKSIDERVLKGTSTKDRQGRLLFSTYLRSTTFKVAIIFWYIVSSIQKLVLL